MKAKNIFVLLISFLFGLILVLVGANSVFANLTEKSQGDYSLLAQLPRPLPLPLDRIQMMKQKKMLEEEEKMMKRRAQMLEEEHEMMAEEMEEMMEEEKELVEKMMERRHPFIPMPQSRPSTLMINPARRVIIKNATIEQIGPNKEFSVRVFGFLFKVQLAPGAEVRPPVDFRQGDRVSVFGHLEKDGGPIIANALINFSGVQRYRPAPVIRPVRPSPGELTELVDILKKLLEILSTQNIVPLQQPSFPQQIIPSQPLPFATPSPSS